MLSFMCHGCWSELMGPPRPPAPFPCIVSCPCSQPNPAERGDGKPSTHITLWHGWVGPEDILFFLPCRFLGCNSVLPEPGTGSLTVAFAWERCVNQVGAAFMQLLNHPACDLRGHAGMLWLSLRHGRSWEPVPLLGGAGRPDPASSAPSFHAALQRCLSHAQKRLPVVYSLQRAHPACLPRYLGAVLTTLLQKGWCLFYKIHYSYSWPISHHRGLSGKVSFMHLKLKETWFFSLFSSFHKILNCLGPAWHCVLPY